MWAREFKDANGQRGGLLESVRWIEGYERVAELATQLPETRLVYVADREADIAALMARARDLGHPADGLIRSRHHRALPDGGKLWASVTAGLPLGEVCFTLPSRHGQKARWVRQQVWAQRVELSDGKRGRVAATCMVAREVHAPAGVKPIEWRQLTNREASTFEAVAELIDGYRARWEIELFFDILKNACRIEALPLSTIERLERALGAVPGRGLADGPADALGAYRSGPGRRAVVRPGRVGSRLHAE